MAIGRITVPPRGSVTSDMLTSIAAMAAGARERQEQRRAEALRNAMLELQKRQTAAEEGRVETARTEAERAEEHRVWQRGRVEARESDRPALVTEIRAVSRQLGEPVNDEELQAMSIEGLDQKVRNLNQRLDAKSRERQLQLQSTMQERSALLAELQRLEEAITQARILRNQEAQRIESDALKRLELKKRADELARAANRAPGPIYQELVNREIDGAMQAYGPGGDLRVLMDRAHQLRLRLAGITEGRGEGMAAAPPAASPNGISIWTTLPAEAQAAREQAFKDALQAGQRPDMDAYRIAGWPVDQWLMELEQEAQTQEAVQQLSSRRPERMAAPQDVIPTYAPQLNLPAQPGVPAGQQLILQLQELSMPGRNPLAIDPVYNRFVQSSELRRRGAAAPAPGVFSSTTPPVHP